MGFLFVGRILLWGFYCVHRGESNLCNTTANCLFKSGTRPPTVGPGHQPWGQTNKLTPPPTLGSDHQQTDHATVNAQG